MLGTDSKRRGARLAGASILAVALVGLTGTALAAPNAGGIAGKTVKGSPQPEMKPFVVAKSTGASGTTTTSGLNGTLITAYDVATANTDGAIQVCVLARGARSCESKTTLNTLDNSSLFGTPLVFEAGGDVYVIMEECCADENNLEFVSTDGGKTFGAPVNFGTTGGPNIDASEAFGDPDFHVMWAEDNAGTKLQVEYVALNAPGTGTVVTAMTDSAEFNTAGLGSYKGGVIAAGSDFHDVTVVSFAPALSTVFHRVGRFKHQDLIAVSRSAVVTQRTTGNESLVLHMFNGTGFDPPHTVPASGGGGPNWNTAYQVGGGKTYIFTERHGDSYNLEMQSSSTGATWSGRTDLGNAVANNELSAAIDTSGSGFVVGTSGPVTVFPVLAAQPISFTLSKSKVAAHKSVTGKGVGSDPAAGRTVRLQQREKKGRWLDIATTHEHSNGSFSFHIGGLASGHYAFRAVVDDLPGYLQYGYSAARSLTVVTPKH